MDRQRTYTKIRGFAILCCALTLIGCEKSPPPQDATATPSERDDTVRHVSSAQYETRLGHFDCNDYSPLDFLH